MGLVSDIFSIGKDVMSAAMKAERAQRLQVAEHFQIEEKFFERIGQVLHAKELMASGGRLEGHYEVIVSTAGFLEGYAESLRAQAGKQ